MAARVLLAAVCLSVVALSLASETPSNMYCAPTDDPTTCSNLVQIGQLLNYQSWQFKRGWLTNMTYCLWDGINCNANSNVVILLDLSMNNIVGPIPQVIGTMTALQHLSFAGNSISGPLPDFLGNLVNLNFLSLNKNQFTGSVPDSYAAFSQMVEFDLSFNQITGSMPDWIAKFSQLQKLWLNTNQFTGTIGEDFCYNQPFMTNGLADLSNNHFSCPLPSCMQPPNPWPWSPNCY